MDPHTPRSEADRWLGIAEKLLASRDLVGSRSFAIRARESDPTNPTSEQILAVVDTLMAAEKRVINSGHYDWYSILQLSHLVRDPDLIASHYRRLVLLLNPDHNHLPYADFAIRVVFDAWSVLSDPAKKWMYDSELAVFLQRGNEPPPEPARVDSSSSSAATYQFFHQPTQPQPQQQQWIQHHLHQQEPVPVQLQEQQLFRNQNQPQQQQRSEWEQQQHWLPQHQQPIAQRPQQWLPEQQRPPPPPQPLQQQQAKEPAQFPPQLQRQQPTEPAQFPPQLQRQQQQQQPKSPPPQLQRQQQQPKSPPPQLQRQQQQQSKETPQFPPQLQRQQQQQQQQPKSPPPQLQRQQQQPKEPTQFPPQLQRQQPAEPQFPPQLQRQQQQQHTESQIPPQLHRQQESQVPPQLQRQQESQIPPQLQRQQPQQNKTPTPPPPAPALAQQTTPPHRPLQQTQKGNDVRSKEDGMGRGGNVVNENAMENGEMRSDSADVVDNGDYHDDGGIAGSFWTACPYCYHLYEYSKAFEECTLRCQNCRRAFQAVQVPNPPGAGDEASFCSWGFFPIGFSMTSWKKSAPSGNGVGANWTPFSPMFACPVQQGAKTKKWTIVDASDEEEDLEVSSDDSDSSGEWGSNRKKVKRANGRSKRGRPPGRKSNAEREKMANQRSAGGENSQIPRNDMVNNNNTTNTAVASGSLKKQTGKGVRGRKKLDLNVEFSNEVEDHAAAARDGNGEEIGFFEGLDEFLSTLPILHVVGDDKAKPS